MMRVGHQIKLKSLLRTNLHLCGMLKLLGNKTATSIERKVDVND